MNITCTAYTYDRVRGMLSEVHEIIVSNGIEMIARSERRFHFYRIYLSESRFQLDFLSIDVSFECFNGKTDFFFQINLNYLCVL